MQKKTTIKAKAAGRVVTKTARPKKTVAPSREEIAQRAYEIYLARGKTGGRELEDWVQAERELTGENHCNN